MRLRQFAAAAVTAFAAVSSVQVLAQDYAIPAGTPAHIRAGIESPERGDDETARDPARLPAEMLTLAGLQSGDRVIEIAGLGGYYTKILSAAVGDQGELHVFDLPYTTQFVGDAPREYADAHANTEYYLGDYAEAEFPADTDLVLNILYYHDLGLQGVDTAQMNAALFAALKPGGAYLIIDHRAEDGSGWRDVESLHRMGVELIVEQLTAEGFVLEAESDLLANPEDDRTAMVFAPGTRGATDRAVFLFRKPE